MSCVHFIPWILRGLGEVKALFVFAPDIKIKTHPIRFGLKKVRFTSGPSVRPLREREAIG